MTYTVPPGRYSDVNSAFVQAYIDAAIAGVIDLAPETLNSLNELAAAINDDPAFFTTMATANAGLQTNIDNLTAAAATARGDLQTLLQAAVDAVQADVDANETAAGNAVSAEATARGVALTNLQTTLQAAIDAVQTDVNQNETDSDAADAALSGRLDVLEADPTTATALAAVQADVDANEAASDTAEAALSGRLDVLEADPTTKTYVDTQVAGLVDSAPGVLNTLDELAAALGDDANFATTITNSIAAVQADVDQNETDADAAIAAVQADVDQNESDADAAIAVVQADVDQNEADADAAIAALQADVDQNEADADAAIATKFDKAGGVLTGSLVVNKSFPDLELKANDEKRLLFSDAGGASTAAIKHVSSTLDFYAGGIASGNKELVVSSTGVEVLANLTLSGGLTDAANDGAAASAGVAVGQLYRNGSVVMIRVS